MPRSLSRPKRWVKAANPPATEVPNYEIGPADWGSGAQDKPESGNGEFRDSREGGAPRPTKDGSSAQVARLNKLVTDLPRRRVRRIPMASAKPL